MVPARMETIPGSGGRSMVVSRRGLVSYLEAGGRALRRKNRAAGKPFSRGQETTGEQKTGVEASAVVGEKDDRCIM